MYTNGDDMWDEVSEFGTNATECLLSYLPEEIRKDTKITVDVELDISGDSVEFFHFNFNYKATNYFSGQISEFPNLCGTLITSGFYLSSYKLDKTILESYSKALFEFLSDDLEYTHLIHSLNQDQEYIEKFLLKNGYRKELENSFVNRRSGNTIHYYFKTLE